MTRNLRRLVPTEADTLRAITDWLETNDYLYLRHSPSNVVGKAGKATFRRPRASQLGAPDLIVFVGTWGQDCLPLVLAVEVKSPTGKLSKVQSDWADRAAKLGIQYICV